VPFISLDELRQIAVCPRCRGSLSWTAASVARCSRCTVTYGAVGRWPVLVDESRSLLDVARLRLNHGEGTLVRKRTRNDRRLPTYLRQVRANVGRFVGVLKPNDRVLVVGGGEDAHGLGLVYDDPSLTIVGFDLYTSEFTQFVADAHQIPLEDGSVDAVVVQAVLEHVLQPEVVVSEIHRVLKPNGIVYAETAFLQAVHEGPFDFARFTELGHRWLFRAFSQIEAGPIGGPGLQTVWAADYLLRGIFRSRTAGLRTRRLVMALNGVDRFIPMAFRSDAAPAVYFMGRRSEEELDRRCLVDRYGGAQR
jgi:SAM-dependent methyltransferase